MLSHTDDRLGHGCSCHGMHLDMLSCGHGCSGHRMNSNVDVIIVLRNQTWMLNHPVGMDALVIVRCRTWMLLSCWPGCSGHRMQLNMDAICLLSCAVQHGCLVGMDTIVIVYSRTWKSLSCALEPGCYPAGTDALVIIVCTRTWTMVIVRSQTWMLCIPWAWMLWSWSSYAAEHGYHYPAQSNMDVILWAWMLWSLYALEHGLWSLYAVEYGYYYPVGTDAMVIVRSRTWILSCAAEMDYSLIKNNLWAWMLWTSSTQPNMDDPVHSNMDVIILWTWLDVMVIVRS